MLNIQKQLNNAFYALMSLPATAMGFALCVQISALSWILSTQYKLNIEQVSYVWAAGPLAGIIGQLLVGKISDGVWFWNGRRRPFILIGGTLAALMLLCLPNLDSIAAGLGTTNLLAVALLVALTLDLAINISFNPTRSLIADLTPEGTARTKGYTIMQTVSGSLGVLAYFIGTMWGNYALIYIGVAVVLLFSWLPTLLLEEPRQLTSAATVSDISTDDTKPEKPAQNMWAILIAHGFTWLGVQTMFVFIFAYLKHVLGLDDATNGKTIAMAFLILNSVGFILPATVLNPLAQRIGRVKTHTLCLVVMALAYWGILFAGKSTTMLYLFMAVAGVGWASVVSLPFAIVADRVDSRKMGWFMGIFNLSVVIPQLIVSALIGSIIEKTHDKNIIFIICAIALSISSVLWLLVKNDKE